MNTESYLLKAKVLLQAASEAAQAADEQRAKEMGALVLAAQTGKELYDVLKKDSKPHTLESAIETYEKKLGING